MEGGASQNEEHAADERVGRRGSLVAVRVDGQAVGPDSPNAVERVRPFVMPAVSYCFLDRVTTTTCR